MSWVVEELKSLDLGDKRLDRRAMQILENLGLSPGRTIPQTFQVWSEIKACYNFMNNTLVSEDKLLKPHQESTITRIKEHKVVLLISDTCKVDYTDKEAMVGRQRLTNTHQKGLWLHSTIAVTPERVNLGVVDVNFWDRDPIKAEDRDFSSTERDNAPIEVKESYRWLRSYIKCCEVAAETPNTQVINITDREGDIIEIYEAAAQQKTKEEPSPRFIIRSQYNRWLDEKDESGKIHKKLREKLKESDSLGEIEFVIPATENRAARKVKQQIKATTVVIKSKKKKLKLQINAVMATEINPPSGESPLTWIFITDLPIRTCAEAIQVIQYYLVRWEIELFFKILKSGCKIEERQLQTTDRMKNLISMFLILAWRVQYTMMMGRVCSQISAGDLFDPAEWKGVYKILNRKKALPRKPPLLGEFIIMVARLGGYVETNTSEPPGVKTVWKGMARMIDFSLAWEAFRE
jgi:hypothetical protein